LIARRIELLREMLRAGFGNAEACHNLGVLYATGDHGEWPEIQDAAAAARWYERGAKRGDAECLYDLGFMSILGEFPGADRSAGVRYLEQSANRGYCDAIRLLSDLYSRGLHGVPANPEHGELWSRKLAEHLALHPEDARKHERS
jgi:TPR repeat protein